MTDQNYVIDTKSGQTHVVHVNGGVMSEFQFPDLQFGRFTVRECAQIADMPEELVRLWSSRGHIEAKGRGAVYPASEVAEAMVRYDLSRHGIPPSDTRSIGHKCAGTILRLVMLNHPEACSVSGPRIAVATLKSMQKDSAAVTSVLFGLGAGDELLVRMDGSDLTFMPSATTEFEVHGYRSALIFNLEGYAHRLATMAGKPIMTFSFPCEPGEKEIQTTLAED